jgi:hypothetical protein
MLVLLYEWCCCKGFTYADNCDSLDGIFETSGLIVGVLGHYDLGLIVEKVFNAADTVESVV